MRSGVVSQGTTPEEYERPKDGLHEGVGALLLLAGSALVFPEARRARSSIGGGLGFLLLLVGSGMIVGWLPWESHPAP